MPTSSTPRPFGSAAALRPPAKQYSLHPLERTLAGIVIALLVFLPWALGGMRLWGQWIALALATLAFVVALIPRNYTERHHASGHLRLYMFPKLYKFPLFWLGLIYFALIVCQILNPAWTYRSSSAGWWLEAIDYIKWLPHGLEGTPFKVMNGWRTLMIHGTAWLMVCALWIGITRRRALLVLLITLACNAVLLGCLAIAQRVTGTDAIFWSVPSSNIIWGTFFYRNHAAAWFNLMVPITCGLAAWFQLRALKSFAKSSPAAVLTFLALFLSVIVVGSHSRGGVISLVVFIVTFFVAYVIRHLTLPAYPRRRLVIGVLGVLFCFFAVQGLRELNAKETWSRFDDILKGNDESVLSRRLATRATFDMWQDDPWLGHGAGGYRFLFPLYQQQYPAIWAEKRWDNKTKTTKYDGRRLLWENAHNDPVQALAELGILGVGLLTAGGIWWLVAAIQRGVFTNLMGLSLSFGLAAILAHSWGEFVFHCPAILLTWLALLTITLLWCERDGVRR
ncbi:MAG: O-antigen ligase family protein [Opitutaceae bacterium]|nr:O-antigen ligase family protein [Opitutaceae bacterium]